jgi:hypothetical protein
MDGGSALRKAATYTQNNTNMSAPSGIGTHDPSVRAGEDCSCLDRTATVICINADMFPWNVDWLFNRLHGDRSQKTVLFIRTAVRTSDPAYWFWSFVNFVKYGFLTAVTVTAFQDVTPCSVVVTNVSEQPPASLFMAEEFILKMEVASSSEGLVTLTTSYVPENCNFRL